MRNSRNFYMLYVLFCIVFAWLLSINGSDGTPFFLVVAGIALLYTSVSKHTPSKDEKQKAKAEREKRKRLLLAVLPPLACMLMQLLLGGANS